MDWNSRKQEEEIKVKKKEFKYSTFSVFAEEVESIQDLNSTVKISFKGGDLSLLPQEISGREYRDLTSGDEEKAMSTLDDIRWNKLYEAEKLQNMLKEAGYL